MKRHLLALILCTQALFLTAGRCSDDDKEQATTSQSPEATSPAQENTADPMMSDDTDKYLNGGSDKGSDVSTIPPDDSEFDGGEAPDDSTGGEISDY